MKPAESFEAAFGLEPLDCGSLGLNRCEVRGLAALFSGMFEEFVSHLVSFGLHNWGQSRLFALAYSIL